MRFPRLGYTGTDVAQALLDHAAPLSPAGFRFLRHTDLSLPAPDGSVDFVVAFSVFTHLRPEESYVYLRDEATLARARLDREVAGSVIARDAMRSPTSVFRCRRRHFHVVQRQCDPGGRKSDKYHTAQMSLRPKRPSGSGENRATLPP